MACIIFLIGCHAAAAPQPSDATALFLVQTSPDAYTLLDVKKQTAAPYEFPGGNQQYDLAAGLSPNCTQMILPIGDCEVAVMDLSPGEIHTTYKVASDSPIFQIDESVQAVRASLPDLNYSEERLVMALDDAYRQSKMNIQWFKDEDYRLSVLDGSPTSTHLTLDNHQRGTREQLENKPGLVEDYWVEPNSEQILLKKGVLFEAGIWQDDRYYLVDVNKRSVSAIPLPASVDNPMVFWFAPDMIGIIHKPGLLGGTNFSLFNTTTMESHLVLEGAFSGINTLGTNLVSYLHNRDNQTTEFSLRKGSGHLIDSQTLQGFCSVKNVLDEDRLLINCEEQSFLLKQDPFSILPFREPIQIVAHSPDRTQMIVLFNDLSSIVYSEDLQEAVPLKLPVISDEIHWLPDSSGFLYRSRDQILYHDFTSRENHLLFSSDFFIDYRNLNGVWIQIER